MPLQIPCFKFQFDFHAIVDPAEFCHLFILEPDLDIDLVFAAIPSRGAQRPDVP